MREQLKHIFRVLTPPEKKQFWIQILLNVFISIADIAMLAALLFVVSFYINSSSGLPGILPAWTSDRNSITLILIFFLLFTIKNFLGIIISNAQFNFTGKVAIRISKQKLDSYLTGDFFQFTNIDSAEYIRKIAFQPFEFCQHILGGIQQIIIQASLILLTIIAIILFNAELFLLLLIILLPPVVLVFFFIKRRVSAGKKNIHAANESSFRYLLDALKGYVESNIYNRNDFFLQRFTNARKEFSKHLFNSLSVQAMPGRIIETFAVLGLFILIAIIKFSGVNDNATIITIGAFIGAAYKIIPGIVKIINASGQMKTYDFSIYDLEVNKEKEKNNNDGRRVNEIQSLQFHNISFRYDDRLVLSDFSFCVDKGDFIGISGRSGRGKTTILNLILGFLASEKGEILINNTSRQTNELKNFWPSVSYVRQQPFLIHDSVLRNIILDEKVFDQKKLEQVIEISGLKNFINESADGLNKMITENGKNISGGQQQRICIARALYKNADLILLDEPFNELDDASAVLLINHFKDMAAAGKIIILITHDSKSMKYCNKIIALDE